MQKAPLPYLLNQLFLATGHLHHTFTSETPLIKLHIIINLRELLVRLNDNSLLAFPRWFWRVHIIIYIVSFISEIFEHITTEMSNAGISKVVFNLLIKGSAELSELMDTPFLHVFMF